MKARSMENSLDDVIIEIATPQDAEAISELLRETWRATYPNKEIGITEEDIRLRTDGENGEYIVQNIERWRKNIESTDDKATAYIALKGGKIVGFTYPTIAPNGQRYIGALYVLPEAQDQGVGSRLIQANLAWHGEDEPVYLVVAAYNQNAIKFYKKFGFIETGNTVEDLSARKRGLKELPEIEMIRPVKNEENL